MSRRRRRKKAGRAPKQAGTTTKPEAPAPEGQPVESAPSRPSAEWKGRLLWSLVIFAAAFAVRLAHVLFIRDAPFFELKFGDAEIYDLWARTIASGDWLGSEVFYQAPLYPYFLGTLYTLVSSDPLVVRLSQAVLGALACVFLAMAGWRFFSKPVGILAGFMLALYAPAIFFDGLIQKSALDLFFFCLALWILSELNAVDREPRRYLWWLLGMALGGLILTRENALLLVAPILLWLALRRDAPTRSRIVFASLFFGGLATLLAPVAIRNMVVGGELHLTTSQLGPNLFIGNNENADGTYRPIRPRRGYAGFERDDATRVAEEALGRELSPAEVSSYYVRRVLDFVRAEPGRWLALMWRKFVLTWNAVEIVDTEDQYTYSDWSPPLRWTGTLFHFGVLAPLAVLGVFVTWGGRQRLWLLYLILATYAASVVMFYVFARYRFPLAPVLILFAAAGVLGASAFFRNRSFAQNAPALAAIAAMAVFSNWQMIEKRFMRASTHYNLAAALESRGRVAEAVEEYERALDWDPTLAQAHYNLGNILTNQGQPDGAIDHFEEAIRYAPDYSEAHNNLAYLLFYTRRDRDRAATHYEKAIELDPKNEEAQYNLGNIYFGRGDLERAGEQYRAALALNPQHAQAHYTLGNVFYRQGKLDEAVAKYEEALAIDPYLAKAYNNLGIIAAVRGNLEEAVKHFRTALDIDPDYEEARTNLMRAENPR